ncbi:uncharacterized protein LOC119185189 [Rhipicephalus microplus]|uniref:uncharacterized protein LOC119185189 n=1 Tax=Rhipicephalus microplus TaxID=6941 RepID=UPI00188934C5|nr:uncharacterized protein LOC119185189 [Rhipicephalus microplus]
MRLISLTSSVRRVMEHARLNRVTTTLEKQDAFGTHTIGFRRGLSTQNAMRQIKGQVVNAPSQRSCTLLGLDLKSTFNIEKHAAIFDKINQLDLGSKFYRYVNSLIPERT